MASVFDVQRDKPSVLHTSEAGISWARAEAPLVKEPARKSEPHPSDRIDINAGWPPRRLGMTDVRMLAGASSSRHFTLDDRRASVQAALAHPDVPDLLQGRWEVLACNLVCEKSAPRHVTHRVRVSLFNYTTNTLIEICVEDRVAISVELKESHVYPEAPIEMAQAISLARGAPELKGLVEDLAAHAILQVPTDPHGPSFRHRCILVMFTDKNDPHRELPVRYSAMVDLRLQRVLRAGPSSCGCENKTPD